MRIAFDFQIFLLQKYGGISRYFVGLAENLQTQADVKIVAPLHINSYLNNLSDSLAPGIRIKRIPKTGPLLFAANNLLFKPIINRLQPDIIHETYYSLNSYAPKSAKRVVTVYDMIHERFPSLFNAGHFNTEAKRIAVQRADHVICISEHTRKDLVELFNVDENKLSVVYLGYDSMQRHDCENSMVYRFLGGRPYLLYVGFRGGHKNFEGIVKAYASSYFLRKSYSLIFFGGGNFNDAEIRLFLDLGLDMNNISQLSGGDQLLASCYQGAAAFIYPSLYEGFGIPPLEAMSCDCPVICTNASSVPEVVGEAGEYFEPDQIDSIRYAIERVLKSSKRRAELIENGRIRCHIFSWARTASETLNIYRKVI